MALTFNLVGQVKQMNLPQSKALWPVFEAVVNSIQSLEDSSISDKKITILANRTDNKQLSIDGEIAPFDCFEIIDNGIGFNTNNYSSFLEAYSDLKINKGCKGIGRFLWLKAFESVQIRSVYIEDEKKFKRDFSFSLNGIEPENNNHILDREEPIETHVFLNNFKSEYRDSISSSLDILGKKIIEHCLPYFLFEDCPLIVLRDDKQEIVLNDYYKDHFEDSVSHDEIVINGLTFVLYHMAVSDGVSGHNLHFCANSREVKSYDLTKLIPDLPKKKIRTDSSFYYVGYLTGDCLNSIVNTERSSFNFDSIPNIDFPYSISEEEILDSVKTFVEAYLNPELTQIHEEKRTLIDQLVENEKPQYRFLLNNRPETYDVIPAGLTKTKIELELYKQEQMWEFDLAQTRIEIEQSDSLKDASFNEKFEAYCQGITELSKASLAQYVARRKAILDLLQEAMNADDNNKYSKEERLHSIICPMHVSSSEVPFDDMNLWIVDDRLAFHNYLASDKPMKSLPILETDSKKRMDISVFDTALSFSEDGFPINSISIIELKRPQRDFASKDDDNPIKQVLEYVKAIKDGKVKKANGRDFGNTDNVAFYCYIIADLTNSLIDAARFSDFTQTPDKQGYFGFNSSYGAYVEIISYDKLLSDAKKRNEVLFDKLFRPKSDQLIIANGGDNE